MNFEPKDFSQNSKYNLHLTKDASLSDEYILMFNEKEIQDKLRGLLSQVN